MKTIPGDFSKVWPALTPEAQQEIAAAVATSVQGEHQAACRRLREILRAPANKGSDTKRLLAFLDVIEQADLLDLAGEA